MGDRSLQVIICTWGFFLRLRNPSPPFPQISAISHFPKCVTVSPEKRCSSGPPLSYPFIGWAHILDIAWVGRIDGGGGLGVKYRAMALGNRMLTTNYRRRETARKLRNLRKITNSYGSGIGQNAFSPFSPFSLFFAILAF